MPASRCCSRLCTTVPALLCALALLADAAQAQGRNKLRGSRMADPVAFYFPGYDRNGDGLLDPAEWGPRGNFALLDANRDGFIDRQEFATLYGRWSQGWQLQTPVSPSTPPVFDTRLEADQLSPEAVGLRAGCTLSRMCEGGDALAEDMGLIETGLAPQFPPDHVCPGVDETYAEPYTDKTGKGRHGGIDIPVAHGTPVLAAAAGTVVGKIDNEYHARGKTLVLRHSPEDTGLPFWTYTEYAHLAALPPQALGQRVRLGESLGESGNTGVKPGGGGGTESARRPGLHFAVYYAQDPRHALVRNYLVPEGARWMDPLAFYRLQGPYDSAAMAALSAGDKAVAVGILRTDGSTVPANTLRIWPYPCQRSAAPG
ncbi:MAG: peptidoglycan DD-metalloendopeptidase family protein [Rhodoferax sp.]